MQVSANSTRAAQQAQQAQLYHDDTRNRPIVHSGRLVYAKPEDLPSFPSIGLDAKGSAASAAATLGWANKRSPEPWRPVPSAYASTAATMAEDYKSAPTWKPVASSHGAKAALLAAQSATTLGVPKPSPTGDGLSAATLAFKSQRTSPYNMNPAALGHQRSLVAAKGAVAQRQRAGSAPTPRESYPDEANAAANALNAATRAHRPSLSPTPLENAGAVPYTTMNRLMFTSRPPVKTEVDEQKRADVLHASAIAMAKKMYNQQQKMIEAKKNHADPSSRGNLEVSSSISDDPQPAQLTTLQDAAYKQAQARLAKMQQDIELNNEFQDYYGTKQLSHRFSVKGKLRKRSLSDGVVIEDQRRSQEIRKQMSLLSNRLSEVDEHKRQHDQDLLLAAAQRNVHERLKGMDAKIAADTGMAPPPTLTQWELKSRAIAQSRDFLQPAQQQGKVDIGAERTRQMELRLETERKRDEQEAEKARRREVQDMQKKIKQQEKSEQRGRRAEEKQAKARKEDEKAAKAEQKKLARAVSSVEHDQQAVEEIGLRQNTTTLDSSGQPVRIPLGSTLEAQAGTSSEGLEESPTSPGRIKTWIKSRFSRGPKSPTEESNKGKATQKRFIGGVSLTRNRRNTNSTGFHSRSNSAQEVTMAGRDSSLNRSRLENDLETVSHMSVESEDELVQYQIGYLSRAVFTPPRPIRDSSPAQGRSPVRDSRFHENI
ncbi:hypothetical protein SAMD00023353_0901730 [Rosellinia necatrix]|uniref:Eisosome protein 1 protein n=1 Tax=Rosellinia necatrix TaxID=77044 RepID=A0A1W2TLI8_ROSNE|nr:hypothetical protein SAMD00023353_0901730 [Rosellinia necatrix]